MVLPCKWCVTNGSSGYERNVNNNSKIFSGSGVAGRLTSGADLNLYFDRATSSKLQDQPSRGLL